MKKPFKLALLPGGLILLLLLSVPTIYVGYEEYSLRHQGEVIAKKADAFELKQGHVPTTLQEIGERSDRLSYYSSGPHHYTIRYMDWASAVHVFDSDSRRWEFKR